MHALLVTYGTSGDVYPYVGLGAQLRARGHRVTLAAPEAYRELAEDYGMAFRALVSEGETKELLGHPDFWHPLKTAQVSARWGLGFLDRHYALISELARDEDTVLAANPAVLAARVVQERTGRPMATLILQPWIVPSVYEPPVMPVALSLPRWAPRPFGNLYWWLFHTLGDLFVGRELNRLRCGLGLRPTRRLFHWWHSPDLSIGLFPEWYAPPQPDWPPQMRLTGFPMFDGHGADRLPPRVLEFCRAGAPPVVFTFGTGMMHADVLFRAALDACQRLGVRGLFLTRYRHQLPETLPDTVLHCEFAPFQKLFPLCAAVAHHGGIGTTAKALATGTPQLIFPFAFDQRDNATRVKRLGAGDWLKPRRRTGTDIAAALARLMTAEVKASCRAAAARFGDEDGLDNAAGMLEELAERAGRRHFIGTRNGSA